jgi:prophage regulatory protein
MIFLFFKYPPSKKEGRLSKGKLMNNNNQQEQSMDILPREYLRMEQVATMIGVARSTIFKYIKERGFPKGRKLSERLTLYKYSEVIDWIESNLKDKD